MIAQGKLQFDLWNVTPSNLWDWDSLRNKIKQYGVYNSLLTALMPTASTSQIMGNYEMFEPITSNMFTRNTLSGTYQIINKYLIIKYIDENVVEVVSNGQVTGRADYPDMSFADFMIFTKMDEFTFFSDKFAKPITISAPE